mgnify:CR=1 FL=1
MKTYTHKKLNNILELHKKWLNNEIGGVRADLRDVNLKGANLRNADLSGANLSGANLNEAWLENTDLRGADLRGVNLNGAYLKIADLRSADLNGADLRSTNLNGANLSNSNLSRADLRGANLTNTNLTDIWLWDFIKDDWAQTTPTPFKGLSQNAGKIFKVKKTGKLGFILPYQIFKGWNRGFCDGQVGNFEMGEGVEILE